MKLSFVVVMDGANMAAGPLSGRKHISVFDSMRIQYNRDGTYEVDKLMCVVWEPYTKAGNICLQSWYIAG